MRNAHTVSSFFFFHDSQEESEDEKEHEKGVFAAVDGRSDGVMVFHTGKGCGSD